MASIGTQVISANNGKNKMSGTLYKIARHTRCKDNIFKNQWKIQVTGTNSKGIQKNLSCGPNKIPTTVIIIHVQGSESH